jgi:hypothetical protein
VLSRGMFSPCFAVAWAAAAALRARARSRTSMPLVIGRAAIGRSPLPAACSTLLVAPRSASSKLLGRYARF